MLKCSIWKFLSILSIVEHWLAYLSVSEHYWILLSIAEHFWGFLRCLAEMLSWDARLRCSTEMLDWDARLRCSAEMLTAIWTYWIQHIVGRLRTRVSRVLLDILLRVYVVMGCLFSFGTVLPALLWDTLWARTIGYNTWWNLCSATHSLLLTQAR